LNHKEPRDEIYSSLRLKCILLLYSDSCCNSSLMNILHFENNGSINGSFPGPEIEAVLIQGPEIIKKVQFHAQESIKKAERSFMW
jgi:hypothetical protein